MLLLVLFAFIAGIVTILSPCILPILPIVLSGSIGGGKRRPLGVITGFIASFTLFTLFLSTIIRLTGISADALRLFSVLVIAGFGISLIIPQFQQVIERLFSRLAGLAPKSSSNNSGFLGGVLIGLSLGLVWTPCVGPILASIISLSFTGTVTSTAFLITLAYSLGTALPMLAITYGGRQLLQNHPWLLKNTGKIQKVFGLVMIVTALAILFNFDRKFQAYILEKFPNYGIGLTKFEDNVSVQSELKKLQPTTPLKDKIGKPLSDMLEQSDIGKAPELIVGGIWMNSYPLTLKDLRGKVVLVDFWTYTCINCIRTLPYLKSWHQKYKDKGLVIIGVHTPEFEFEKNPDNVEKAIKDFGIEYPVMQDNDYATWNAYNNRYWPAEYFIDKTGKIRRTHFGEGDYDESELFLQKLLEEKGESIDIPISNPTYTIQARTPETYLGYKRLEYLSSPEKINVNQKAQFTAPAALPNNQFALSGFWTIGDEYAMPEKGSALIIDFEAKDVFLVMRPKENQEGKIKVYLEENIVSEDSRGVDVVDGIVTVDTDRLYSLVKFTNSSRHILRLEFLDNNLELYAFTFG